MPSIDVYLSEEEMSDLAALAEIKGLSLSETVQIACQRYVEEAGLILDDKDFTVVFDALKAPLTEKQKEGIERLEKSALWER